jgi:hypothetical protein
MVERIHAPLKHGLRTLSIEHPDDWDTHITQILIAHPLALIRSLGSLLSSSSMTSSLVWNLI